MIAESQILEKLKTRSSISTSPDKNVSDSIFTAGSTEKNDFLKLTIGVMTFSVKVLKNKEHFFKMAHWQSNWDLSVVTTENGWKEFRV